jgi:phage N-6-adenine-methyltransferase
MDLYKGPRSDLWETPPEIIAELKSIGCNFDVASNGENAKFDHFFDANFFDAMVESWPKDRVCFLNPPFSRAREFVEKTVCEAKRGVKIALLYKASNLETAIWQKWIFPNASAIIFLERRVNFISPIGEKANQPPFGCAIAFFNIPFDGAAKANLKGFWFRGTK